MQRFFPQNKNETRSDEEVVDGASSDSWYTTLSTATGWLNPFNMTRDGVSKTFIATFIFLKNITSATAVTCFKIVNDLAANEVTYYKLDCVSSNQENRVLNAITADPQFNATQMPCSQYQRLQYVGGESFGHGYFRPNEYGYQTSMCNMEHTQDFNTWKKVGWNTDLSHAISQNVQSSWGSRLDYKITFGISIPVGLVITAATLLTTFILVNRSKWNKNRRINNKYHSLTEALAENDAVLMDNLIEMTAASNVVLPKDIMFSILQQTKGYDDAKYQHNYSSSPAHDPCPQDFQVTPDNGMRAPFIRFCDTLARENYRRKFLGRHWNQERSVLRINDNARELAEVIVDDNSVPLLKR
jgi:hypothetical protein